MVIASNEREAISLVRALAHQGAGGFRPVGWLTVEDEAVLGGNCAQWDAALLAPNMARQTALMQRCALLGKGVLLVPGAMEMLVRGGVPVGIGDALFLLLRPPGLTAGQRFMKRAFDLAGALALSLALGPVLLIAWIAVRLTSQGPAIFRQDRLGEGGREFTLYKLRTMVADAERDSGPVLAREFDSRITPLGAMLRAARIDELPQLLNVVRGEMSLIGPRPERGFFVRGFLDTVPGYRLRFAVKPGITGLAQVAGNYTTPADRKLRFDLLYISDYSLALDLRIIFKTAAVVLHKERAAGLKPAAAAAVADES
jgi:lipopolysaccharide/colanic/teichoic acid biosynthesis glycosyltransferase